MSRADIAAELRDKEIPASAISWLAIGIFPGETRLPRMIARQDIGRLQAKFDQLNNELSSMLGMRSAKARCRGISSFTSAR